MQMYLLVKCKNLLVECKNRQCYLIKANNTNVFTVKRNDIECDMDVMLKAYNTNIFIDKIIVDNM